MSISSTSASGWGTSYVQQYTKPQVTKDQLNQLDQQLKSQGKDTTNLDKIIANFDQLDTSKDGSLGLDELKNGASQLGIQLPQGGGHHHHHHAKKADNDGTDQADSAKKAWGPPPGLLSDSDSDGPNQTASASDSNSFLLKMLEKFAGAAPDGSAGQDSASLINIAA